MNIPKYAVIAVNRKTGTPGQMGTADSLIVAEEIKKQAIRAGWICVTIIQQFGEP